MQIQAAGVRVSWGVCCRNVSDCTKGLGHTGWNQAGSLWVCGGLMHQTRAVLACTKPVSLSVSVCH